ncbi:MAG TPA: winged helix DNA-binding domain-containing protein [Baekduia sp.]
MSPSTPSLDRRALNRALLARQWLLEPRRASALEAVEHLVGLQAQDVKAPYHQLVPRLVDFEPSELSSLLERREAVRIALMRGTIHLVSARDAAVLRPLVQPMITRATEGNWRVGDEVDRAALAAAGRALVEAQPRTFAQLGALLAERYPDADPAALAQQIRCHVPLVQVPPRGLWQRSGAPAHTSLAAWTGARETAGAAIDDVVLRYLRAFGPATVQDMQKWSGLTRLGAAFDRLRDRLVTFADAETGRRELFDLPDAPRPDPDDAPAPPPILVGPFDNLILSHADTTRVLPAEHRPKVMTQNGLIAGLVLVDGLVAGNWRIKAVKQSATLTVASFSGKAYKKRDAARIAAQAERLLALTAPDAAARDVVFTPSG